jgi:hypothetical protein
MLIHMYKGTGDDYQQGLKEKCFGGKDAVTLALGRSPVSPNPSSEKSTHLLPLPPSSTNPHRAISFHAASPYSQLPSGAFKQVNKSNSPNIEVSSSLASSWHSPFAAEPLLKLERFKIASLASNPRAGR